MAAIMKRRDFFKFLSAGAATMGAVGEIDYERLLWVPGRKTIFLPSEEGVFVPDEATIDKVLAAHGIKMPRYHMTMAGRGEGKTLLFDENWQLMNGREIGQDGQRTRLTSADNDRIQRELGFDVPRRLQRVRLENRPRDIVAVGGELPYPILAASEIEELYKEMVYEQTHIDIEGKG